MGTAPPPDTSSPPALSEERRIVSVLFVDLVGFTERSDRADPEDVKRSLVPFHARVKEDLERFGGTLDKFIGDAVMGVFGAPVAHDDDPLRAVSAGLQILRSIEDLRRSDPAIAVRVAVETGEAVVAFGSGPQIGEAVAGDVVNTASRMQGIAPRDSVVVGETTLRAVRDVFDVEPLPPTVVKGKAEPLRVWRILAERSTATPDVAPTGFVGRELELGQLAGALERAAATSSLQLVTLVGDPGIGKSRLVNEFRRRVGSGTRWLAGKCVPYGEAVTFAPVASMVQQLAAISVTDDAEQAATKLSTYVAGIEADPAERAWLASRLGHVLGAGAPLVGPGSLTGEAGAVAMDTIPPAELASAWARSVFPAADAGAVVVELDDLHWAEPVLIAVVQRLLDGLARRPTLVLCTARPELFERHATWGAGRTNASTIGLAPLNDKETTELLTTLLAQVALPSPSRASLVERAGGNPLYALEFARMLAENAAGERIDVDMPDTVQAVIGARLDAIPPGLRVIVQDASVSGTTFWPGLLAWLGGRPDDAVDDAVEELVRRGLVERAMGSTFETEEEYEFTHALVREVAYGRMPRADRARRHCSAGTWLERASGDRAAERADMLARHFATAVDLAEAAGDAEVADFARQPALRWLMLAGERTGRLDAAGAFALYDRAASLAAPGSPERAEALSHSARMGRRGGAIDGREVLRRYEEALSIARRGGDPLAIGAALTRLGSQAGAVGETARSHELLAEAVATLEDQPPGHDLARAFAFRAEEEMFAGRVDQALRFADRALELPAGGADDLIIMCLHIRGDARCSSGDPRGIDDLREALRRSDASGNASDTVTSENYLAEWLAQMESPAAALDHYAAALALADRRGVVSQGQWTRAATLGPLFDLGHWDRALAVCAELLAFGRERLDAPVFAVARIVRSRISLLRGRPDDADDPEALLALARPVEEMHAVVPALVTAAELALADGDRASAGAYVEEFATLTQDVAAEYRESQLAPIARVCVGIGRAGLARELVTGIDGAVLRSRLNVLSAKALVAEHSGHEHEAAALHSRAAEAWERFGSPFEQAHSLLGFTRCADRGERGRADGYRVRAEALLASLQARPPAS